MYGVTCDVRKNRPVRKQISCHLTGYIRAEKRTKSLGIPAETRSISLAGLSITASNGRPDEIQLRPICLKINQLINNSSIIKFKTVRPELDTTGLSAKKTMTLFYFLFTPLPRLGVKSEVKGKLRLIHSISGRKRNSVDSV